MTELTLPPTRLLKFMAGLARWSLGLLVAFWLLLAAAWGALHGWIVPRIGDWRAPLEAQATRALGAPVRIGRITAHSTGLVPSFELQDVAVLDAQGREALRLARAVVALSPRSLMRGGFEQLVIEQPELDMRRTAQGRILVAGLAVDDEGPPNTAAADWLFSQREVLLRGGTLRWTDEQRGAPPLALTGVDLLLRNHGWRHDVRLDATPPEQWGQRFTLMGQFRQPLLTAHEGAWQQWSGQLYAHFAHVDVARLRQHADLGIEVAAGHGALRAWVDVQRGQIAGGVADVALQGVQATLGQRLQPLALQHVSGRIAARQWSGGFEVSTQALQFVTQDGLRWPGGNVFVRHTAPGGTLAPQGELRADALDLAALAQIASRLPLGDAAHEALRTWAPEGRVETVQAAWRGPLDALQSYQAKGRVAGLALAAQPRRASGAEVPGLRGAAVDFDLTQAGGKAQLSMAGGALLLPGVFEEPELPLDQLAATVRWQVEGAGEAQRISVQASDMRFANADAEGHARLAWRTSDAAQSSSRARFPGVLDLAGTLTRANGARVHRYLPLAVDAQARHYVRDTVRAGQASQVQFRVKGDLNDLPFERPGQGEFHIAARVHDVVYDYAPARLLAPGDKPWPALTQLSGELVFDRASMAVRNARGAFAGSPDIHLAKVEAHIPDLAHTVVDVQAQGRGPLAQMLALVAASPLARMTGHALDQASGSGKADLQLRLTLPINDMDASRVQGSVTLAGNDVQLMPEVPPLARVGGVVQFSDQGFKLVGVQGRALGGEVRAEGGMRPTPAGSAEPAVQIKATGVASAEGLRQAKSLGLLTALAQHASGSAPYTLQLGVRRGVPEIQVTTTLQGMAVNLPPPFAKTAAESVPVRYDNRLLREAWPAGAPLRDQVQVEAGALASALWVRDTSGASPRVLRGAIALGTGEPPLLPAQGVAASVQLAQIDVDAWLARLRATPDKAAPAQRAGAGAANAASAATTAGAADYLPTAWALRTRQLTAHGRTLHDVVAGGSHDNGAWRANLNAQELSGYAEYRPGVQGAPPQVFARLARLTVPQSTAAQLDTLDAASEPGALPALDIVVQDFVLRERHLGRLEIEARNRGGEGGGPREWRLSKFNLESPEATLTAQGNWAQLAGAAQRRTAFNFSLDLRDAGQLLARFGMERVVKKGHGAIEGQLAWVGAPINPDYRTMEGQMHVDVQGGQFLKADPGLAKLLGVLSLQSLPRRLALDFRDVFSEGFAFDFVRGDVRVERGVARTNNLQMKGVNAAVLMEGEADIARETQNLHVVVVPEINAMTASLVATAINPVLGLGSFLAQVFLRGPLIAAATQELRIDGSWAQPRVTRLPRRPVAAPPQDDDPS